MTEQDQIAREPNVVNKGRVFYTSETQYIVSITLDEFTLIREQGHWIKSLTHHLRYSTSVSDMPHLSNSGQFGYGIAFSIRIKDDTPENRDVIADEIANYIELCRVEKERRA